MERRTLALGLISILILLLCGLGLAALFSGMRNSQDRQDRENP